MASRNNVFWIGHPPDPTLAQEFAARGIKLDLATLRSVPIAAASLNNPHLDSVNVAHLISQELGAVFVHDRTALSRTISFLRQVARAPVKDSGARVYIVVSKTIEIEKILRKFVRGSSFADFQEEHNISFQILTKEGFGEFVKSFDSPHPGRAPRLGLIVDLDSPLSLTETTLLQRSFSDCDSLVVRKLADQGFSASVHVAYPQFTSDTEGTRSLPFLVKFDEKKQVTEERHYYNDYVNHYVPFNLRPNIVADRCFTSWNTGILVASYVDKAVPLLEAIEKGAGLTAIHCLLEETLDRWFRNSKCEPGSPAKSLSKLFKQQTFDKNPKVLEEAKHLGAVEAPQVLLATLDSISIESHRFGKSHRDLHARNVLVKGSDAIVIDFSECGDGPLLIDLATLEVTIAFYPAVRDKRTAVERLESWTKFVKMIYEFKRVSKPPEAREGFEIYSRHWACIRQIRRFAFVEQTNDLEYALCLAFALLRHSMFVDHEAVGAKVAGYAYYLCSSLTREIQSRSRVRR